MASERYTLFIIEYYTNHIHTTLDRPLDSLTSPSPRAALGLCIYYINAQISAIVGARVMKFGIQLQAYYKQLELISYLKCHARFGAKNEKK